MIGSDGGDEGPFNFTVLINSTGKGNKNIFSDKHLRSIRVQATNRAWQRINISQNHVRRLNNNRQIIALGSLQIFDPMKRIFAIEINCLRSQNFAKDLKVDVTPFFLDKIKACHCFTSSIFFNKIITINKLTRRWQPAVNASSFCWMLVHTPQKKKPSFIDTVVFSDPVHISL